jgi:hypothetical protein
MISRCSRFGGLGQNSSPLIVVIKLGGLTLLCGWALAKSPIVFPFLLTYILNFIAVTITFVFFFDRFCTNEENVCSVLYNLFWLIQKTKFMKTLQFSSYVMGQSVLKY